MKLILFLFSLSLLAEAAVLKPSWEEISAPGVEKMWRSKSVKGAFISLVKEESTFVLEDFDPKVYVAALPETREFMHNILGIKNYQILKHELIPGPRTIAMKVEGTYLRNKSEKTNFCELHTFTPNSFTQKQAFYPAASSGQVLSSQDCFGLIQAVME